MTRFVPLANTLAVTNDRAETIAARFGARRVRHGRWIAACPAHDDRSPSLSVAAGREGRVLVRCFAGCALTAVLQAVGLHIHDLFSGDLFPGQPTLSPLQQRVAHAERERAQQAHAAQRALEREAVEWLRQRRQQLATSLPSVARQLAMLPDGAPGDDALSAHLHSVLNQIRFIDRVFEGEEE